MNELKINRENQLILKNYDFGGITSVFYKQDFRPHEQEEIKTPYGVEHIETIKQCNALQYRYYEHKLLFVQTKEDHNYFIAVNLND